MTLRAAMTNDDTAWYDLVGQFRQKAQEFERAYADLKSRQSQVTNTPTLAAEYNRLINRAESIRTKIQSVTNTIDSVVGWFDSTFEGINLSGLSAVFPLLPIAVVIGSVTLMVNWITDYLSFSAKLAEIQRLEGQGMTSSQAASIVSRIETESKISTLLKTLTPLAVIGAAIFFANK